MTQTDWTRTVHQPDAFCEGNHCYSCNVDEYGPGYIICPECFHTYRTKRELRRRYRRQLIRLHWRRPAPFLDFDEPTWGEVLWKALTIRAKNINFCQHCIHDF